MNELYQKVLFFISGLILSFLINGIFLKFAATFGNRNLQRIDGQVRWSSTQKPSVGGISFYIVFLLSFSYVVASSNYTVGISVDYLLMGILLPISLGFLIGLADDAYNTKPMLKFLGQLACGLIFIYAGVFIHISENNIINYTFTAIWVVGMMNSINMLDNMDGIVSSVSIVTLIIGLYIASQQNVISNVDVYLMLGTCAALAGFLFYNWNPSKMYMGDTGSQFLGAFLALISIKYFWNIKALHTSSLHIEQYLVPALAFTVPLMDTTTVTIRRILRGQSPFVGGRDHTTHHLAILGLSDRMVVSSMIGLSLVSMGISIYFVGHLVTWSDANTYQVIGFYVAVFITLQILYQIGLSKKRKPQENIFINEQNNSEERITV